MLTFKEYLSEMYAKLSGPEMKKRSWRNQIFIDKMKEGQPFALVSGKEVILKRDDNAIAAIEAMVKANNFDNFKNLEFHAKTGNAKYKISDFGKSPEFGGKGQGAGTAAEDRYLAAFREKIQKALRAEKQPTIPVRLKGRTVEVADVVTTPGQPKSDFHFIDGEGNEVGFFSHKDMTFQQYGGITELNKKFPNHAEITSFVDDVKELTGGSMGNDSYMRPLKDSNLIKCAIFGVDYDTNTPSRQNCDMFLQGDVILKKQGGVYTVSSRGHYGNNGNIRGFRGNFAVTLFCRKGDRNNFGITRARFMVAPYMLRRRSTVDI
mgnify:CR=1 FL=1